MDRERCPEGHQTQQGPSQIQPQSDSTLLNYSDFFQHFGNGTCTGSIGKNSLTLLSIGKISDIYLQTRKLVKIS